MTGKLSPERKFEAEALKPAEETGKEHAEMSEGNHRGMMSWKLQEESVQESSLGVSWLEEQGWCVLLHIVRGDIALLRCGSVIPLHFELEAESPASGLQMVEEEGSPVTASSWTSVLHQHSTGWSLIPLRRPTAREAVTCSLNHP